MTDEPSRPPHPAPPPQPASKHAPRPAVRPGTTQPRLAARAPNGLRVWLDQRTGYSVLVKLIVNEPVTGGARWWYVFGAVLTFLLALEFGTGVLLAAYYAPSVSTAWASTAFIQDTLALGWFVRGLHSFGSSAMLVLAAVHLAQVLIFGAYKAPREMNWLVGLGLMGLLVLFALTGYGLPWDESGYWAKQVETSIIGTTPLVGPMMQTLLQGGNAYGNYTVTHFFTLHAMVLPAVIVLMVAVHVALVHRHGVTPRWGVDEAELARATRPYWPYQAARDATACGLVFAILGLMVIRTHGADLEAPVDPLGSYQARPEWYSLPIYQLRKIFQGSFEMVATMVIPGIAALVLCGLPWLDRRPARDPRRRRLVLGGAAAGAVALGVLGLQPLRHDARDGAFQKARAEAIARARVARGLAKKGVLPEGGLAVFRNDPAYHARELWAEHCAGCHSFSGAPEADKDGPNLKGLGSRAWIAGFLRDPEGPLYMARAKLEKGMKPVTATDDELGALTELVYAETGAPDVNRSLVAKAEPLFAEKDCDSCHDRDGASANTGPNLKGRGTLAYVVDVITDAGDDRLFGPKNKMPRFAAKLSPEEIGELGRFVLSESRK